MFDLLLENLPPDDFKDWLRRAWNQLQHNVLAPVLIEKNTDGADWLSVLPEMRGNQWVLVGWIHAYRVQDGVPISSPHGRIGDLLSVDIRKVGTRLQVVSKVSDLTIERAAGKVSDSQREAILHVAKEYDARLEAEIERVFGKPKMTRGYTDEIIFEFPCRLRPDDVQGALTDFLDHNLPTRFKVREVDWERNEYEGKVTYLASRAVVDGEEVGPFGEVEAISEAVGATIRGRCALPGYEWARDFFENLGEYLRKTYGIASVPGDDFQRDKPARKAPLKVWFDYMHAQKKAGFRFSLKDVSTETGYNYDYVRQEHAKYRAEMT